MIPIYYTEFVRKEYFFLKNHLIMFITCFLVHSHTGKFKGYFSIFPRIESREKDENLMRLK